MEVRDVMVEELVNEVLGPRGGAREVLEEHENPVSEYVTGVLAPAENESSPIEAHEQMPGNAPSGDDENDPGDDVVGPRSPEPGDAPPPALDPLSRPASVGLSFVVESDGPLKIDVCCTWARYHETDEGYERHPAGRVWQGLTCEDGMVLGDTGDEGVAVHVRVRDLGGRHRISLFLVNTTDAEGSRPDAKAHVFQPQIRVHAREGTELVPLDAPATPSDEEEAVLSMLYRNRRGYARGHLCGAMWREIDPERPHPRDDEVEQAPFAWEDGRHLFDDEVLEAFSPADIRTEYIPAVPVNAPDLDWPGWDGPEPELDPMTLSGMWDQASWRDALEPLADAYESWVDERSEAVESELSGPSLEAARSNLNRCREALDRIRQGIDLLCEDETVRLAFCFANRAMATQARWTKPTVYDWWPFQLAFQLMNLAGVVDPTHGDRELCDLLWIPTGGGKTEAYLGLAAFTIAHRRLSAHQSGGDHNSGAGVTVLSRYTLRLLTIQQFRRAAAMVTACEVLRTTGTEDGYGWRPPEAGTGGDWIWGEERISIGLWVGGNVTPNNLHTFSFRDADDQLQTIHGAIDNLERGEGEGEPAQILDCPVCEAVLAVPPEGFRAGESHTLHLVVQDVDELEGLPDPTALSDDPFAVTDVSLSRHHDPEFATLTVSLKPSDDVLPPRIDRWIEENILWELDVHQTASRPTRPGYFVLDTEWGRNKAEKPYDFEIYCPNPECELNTGSPWREVTPAGPSKPHPAFADQEGTSDRVPIPACTVDDQVFRSCPTVVIATVDKFARLPYEAKAGALFGNVDGYNEYLGYYREGSPPLGPSSRRQDPITEPPEGASEPLGGLEPPDLILQDELHLIDGPLGSMVGIYEVAVDLLSSRRQGEQVAGPKYIASTATVRNAEDQVQSVFTRKLSVFPPSGTDTDDTFFSRSGDVHPLDSSEPGRLYVGVCTPGWGPKTPTVRIWSRLLQTPKDLLEDGADPQEVDPFWTLVGYFNAIRELAGAVALSRQDIQTRIRDRSSIPRIPDVEHLVELSSRVDSMRLPGLLERLETSLDDQQPPVDAVFATSMFGTGVDVPRLSLMAVQGQPKTTSAYIQATGRVGRVTGGLVVTFLRASRPRDLNHYEFFSPYHHALYRHVEDITVNPFSPRARDRSVGPVSVGILKNANTIPASERPISVGEHWSIEQRLSDGTRHDLSAEMADERHSPEVEAIPQLFERRAQNQPPLRRPQRGDVGGHAVSELDRWAQVARLEGVDLVYDESSLVQKPSHPVVLGDLAHRVAELSMAYEEAPNSLRDVEATTTFRGWSD